MIDKKKVSSDKFIIHKFSISSSINLADDMTQLLFRNFVIYHLLSTNLNIFLNLKFYSYKN